MYRDLCVFWIFWKSAQPHFSKSEILSSLLLLKGFVLRNLFENFRESLSD